VGKQFQTITILRNDEITCLLVGVGPMFSKVAISCEAYM
jgi:hypothetical protein